MYQYYLKISYLQLRRVLLYVSTTKVTSMARDILTA